MSRTTRNRKKTNLYRAYLSAVSFTIALLVSAIAHGESLLLQSTTSTANSGLYDYLLPAFKARTGVQVHVVAVGTGQAIRNATNCDGDVLLVHARAAEEKFVADGFGVQRFDVMYNDFVIVGPQADTAQVRTTTNILKALQYIADTKAIFASRGDNSGTHKKERLLWKMAAIDTDAGNGRWYRETGAGMGATLNTAVGMGAYTMTDRATWLNFRNRQSHQIVFEGDPQLFNQYGVIRVNPKHCPNVKADTSQAFVEWLTGPEGQRLIAAYSVNDEQLFYPNAK